MHNQRITIVSSLVIASLLAVCGTRSVLAAGKAGSPKKLEDFLQRTDDLYRSRSSIAVIEMEIQTPHWSRSLEMQAWSQGEENTLIRILKPRKEKGVATLKKGQDLWNYFPKVEKVMKLPASMMMGSWMGSDFTNDDLVREYRYSEDYRAEMVETDEYYKITLTPKEKTITIWGRIELFLDKKREIPVKEYFYDEKGKRVREMRFSDVRDVSGRSIPHQMVLIPLTKEGHRTTIRYKSLKLDVPIKDHIFSRQNLQKRI